MKKSIIIILLGFNSFWSFAQDTPNGLPISVSYFAQYAVQPGIKLGTQMPLAGRNTISEKWFLSPQLAFFSNPGDDNNYIINLEAGFKKMKPGKNRYKAFTVGLGYRLQSKLNSVSINLGSGKTDSRERVTKGFVLPTLNYEYGWNTHRSLQWFFKYSIGSSLSTNQERSLAMFAELGVKFNLKGKVSNDE